jgi:AAA+ ATPase superfamily predicted ATPase
MLNEFQEKKYIEFIEAIKNKENLMLSSEDRNVGKTYLLNEIAFELQAIGHEVYILTLSPQKEYFANGYVSFNEEDYIGKLNSNSVVVADETRQYMMLDLLRYCFAKQIPVIGFVNYTEPYKVNKNTVASFKTEYDCQWIGGNYKL